MRIWHPLLSFISLRVTFPRCDSFYRTLDSEMTNVISPVLPFYTVSSPYRPDSLSPPRGTCCTHVPWSASLALKA